MAEFIESRPGMDEPMPQVPKRPYLRSDDRRQQLLEVAQLIVDRDGLAKLNMSQLAKEAGVTRQTVYHHFSDLNDLIEQLLIRRFGTTLEDVEQIATANKGDFVHIVGLSVRVVFNMERKDRDLMRYVFLGLAGDRPELRALVAHLRGIIIDRWMRFLYGQTDTPEYTRARIWAALTSLFGLWDLVDEGLIDVDSAVSILMEISMRLPPPQ